ncbi:endonuclease/exonuclease/phosphatase family protein [Mesorhizobium sp. A623]
MNGRLSADIFERIRRGDEHASPKTVSYGPHLSALHVASYNVHKCVGTDGKFDPLRTGQVIREINADIIALQEADRRFGDRSGILDLVRLEREAGLALVPVSGKTKSHGWHGNVLLFRRGVVRGVHQVTLPGLEPRGAIVAEIDLDAGASIRIIAAHFGLLRHSRKRQAHMISEIVNADDDTPTLLMGDLNEWRFNDRSALSTLNTAFGPISPAVPSFPSRLPLLALDRIITNREDILSPVTVHDTPLARVASDHLPIKAFVDLLPAFGWGERHQTSDSCKAA